MQQTNPKSRLKLPSDAFETRLRTIAADESMAVSDVIDDALHLFVSPPRELRALLLEDSSHDPKHEKLLKEMIRLAKFDSARARFDDSSRWIASIGDVDPEMLRDDEAAMIATAI